MVQNWPINSVMVLRATQYNTCVHMTPCRCHARYNSNGFDNLPSYPPEYRHCSDVVYWRKGELVPQQKNIWKKPRWKGLQTGDDLQIQSKSSQLLLVTTSTLLAAAAATATTTTVLRLSRFCPGLPGWAGTRKVKPKLISTSGEQESVSGSGMSWAICKSALHPRQITSTPPRKNAPYHRLHLRP